MVRLPQPPMHDRWICLRRVKWAGRSQNRGNETRCQTLFSCARGSRTWPSALCWKTKRRTATRPCNDNPQQPAKPLAALDLTAILSDFFAELDDLVAEPLVVSFAVITEQKFLDCFAERTLTEQRSFGNDTPFLCSSETAIDERSASAMLEEAQVGRAIRGSGGSALAVRLSAGNTSWSGTRTDCAHPPRTYASLTHPREYSGLSCFGH